MLYTSCLLGLTLKSFILLLLLLYFLYSIEVCLHYMYFYLRQRCHAGRLVF